MEGAKTAPVDAAESRHLPRTVYGGRILSLPAERHPRQQRDHLQRPAQIAEIMHFPPRPDLSERAADPGVMHAVRARRTLGGVLTFANPALYWICRAAASLCRSMVPLRTLS